MMLHLKPAKGERLQTTATAAIPFSDGGWPTLSVSPALLRMPEKPGSPSEHATPQISAETLTTRTSLVRIRRLSGTNQDHQPADIPVNTRDETAQSLLECVPDNRPATDMEIADSILPLGQSIAADPMPIAKKPMRRVLALSLCLHVGIFALALFSFTSDNSTLEEGGEVVQVVMIGNDVLDAMAGAKPVEKQEQQPAPEPMPAVQEPLASAAETQEPEPLERPELSARLPLPADFPRKPPSRVEQEAEAAPVKMDMELPVLEPITGPPDIPRTPAKAQDQVLTTQMAALTEIAPVIPQVSAMRQQSQSAMNPPLATTPPTEKRLPDKEAPLAPPPVQRSPAHIPVPMPPSAQAQEQEQVKDTQSAPSKPLSKEKVETKVKAVERPVKTKTRDAAPKPVKTKAGNAKADSKKGNADGVEAGKANAKASTAKGAATEGNADVSNYPGKVRSKLKRAWKAPRGAAKGAIIIAFTVNANGSVSRISVSGAISDTIEKAALASVHKASPFPPIPSGTGRSSWDFEVPVVWK